MASDRLVSFQKFVREVTKYGPQVLLPAVARIGAEQAMRHREGPHGYFDPRSGVTPWALTEIARESIVHGVESGRPVNVEDVERLCWLYTNLVDPLTDSAEASVDEFLVRVGFEQFRWQISEFEEMARPRALLVEAASRVPEATAFTQGAWRAALGCSVEEFLDVGFFLYVWAAKHEGWVDLRFLDLEHFGPVLELYPRERVIYVLDHLLAATPSELRSMETAKITQRNVKEHRFNPLVARPLVRMRDGRLLAPHPLLVLHRIGVSGLYYDRVKDPGFTDQLGLVLEAYVRMNLELIPNASLHGEVDLGRAGKSVDFIVVLPGVTLLIEVKATRLTEAARAGLDELHADRERTLHRAQDQINRTHQLVLDGHPALAFVPTDQPFVGLVVTLEPYWLAATAFAPTTTSAVRIVTAALREVEQFCASASNVDVAAALLSLPVEHSNQVLVNSLGGDRTRNPILDRNWDAALRRQR